MTMTTKNLLLLKPKNLLTHPRNMRRFYPADKVREMANSIAAGGGVLQPLIVVADRAKHSHRYFVVDGNMRLAAARLLEDKCPTLECKVVEQREAEQLLSMVVANQVRYDVDPVSEGLHYKALQADGMSVRDISKRTGIYEARITKRKVLADLPEPIQKLIVEEKLPADDRAARAFLSLTEDRAVRLAERLARNPNIKISTIISAAEKLSKRPTNEKPLKRPASELSGAASSGKKSARVRDVREAAMAACHDCNQYEGKLRSSPEPAWAMVVHAADKTCSECPLKDMQKVCASCPAVVLLKELVGRV